MKRMLHGFKLHLRIGPIVLVTTLASGYAVSQSLTPPTITSLFPASGAAGSSFNAYVVGSNLNGVTSAVFTGDGVTASILSGSSSRTALTISISIASNATTGTRALTLKAPAGVSSPATFVVTVGGAWSGTSPLNTAR